MSDLLVRKAATLSDCGKYRYRLSRYWSIDECLTFVMLNPSTADDKIDDPTIRRCQSFARREGAGGVVILNLYAYRSTQPDALRHVNDPFGVGNRAAWAVGIGNAVKNNRPIVCAWGAHGIIHGGYKTFIDDAQRGGARLVCLGKTKEGHPRHPLYVRGDQPFEAFP